MSITDKFASNRDKNFEILVKDQTLDEAIKSEVIKHIAEEDAMEKILNIV